MPKIAVFKNDFGGVSYTGHPGSILPEFDHIPLDVIAEISAPLGRKFWIIDLADLPSDDFRDAWELDESTMGEPAGVGVGSDRTRITEYLKGGEQ